METLPTFGFASFVSTECQFNRLLDFGWVGASVLIQRTLSCHRVNPLLFNPAFERWFNEITPVRSVSFVAWVSSVEGIDQARRNVMSERVPHGVCQPGPTLCHNDSRIGRKK